LAAKELAAAARQRTVTDFLLSPGIFFTEANMTVVTHPLYFSLFPRLKIKLKNCRFDTIEMIESEFQVVLNTLTEQDFQDTFKNGRISMDGAYERKGTTSRAVVGGQ
jgi:hypothetical protein